MGGGLSAPERACVRPAALPPPPRAGRRSDRRAQPPGRADVHARRARRRLRRGRPVAARGPSTGSGRHPAGARRGRRVPPLRPRRGRLRPVSRRPRRRRRHVGRWVLRAALLAIALAVGIALGQSFDDSSAPSGTETLVRTLEPGTQSVQTVTVTVTTTP